MSTLHGNPHAAEVREAYTNGANHRANIEATLALAYEQRTANLIAYAEQMRRDRTSGTNAATTEVLMTVEERLGLGEH